MKSRLLLGVCLSALLLGGVLVVALPRLTASPHLDTVDASADSLAKKYNSPSGLCPWRNPATDLKAFFPTATTSKEEFLTLSRHTGEIEKQLHRKVTGEETGLQIHRVYQGSTPIGVVVARRVKGEYGAIEIVVASDTQNRVVGIKIQRHREPEKTAALLKNPDFLKFFEGKTVQSEWNCHCEQVEISPKSIKSIDAVQGGVHTVMVLLSVQDIWKKA